ncbi:MAG TPA: cytochrome c family protein [Devosiaceae bacterium]|nr:cytochrome c family protein [Devosiaceae bacterium]
MDGFEWNKIIGAILGTLLLVMGIGFIAEAIYHPIEGRGAGFTLPGASVEGAEHGAVEVAEATPLSVLLANASVGAGERQARICAQCHDFSQDGTVKVGPALWDIVGNHIGTQDYAYSAVFTEMAGTDKTWTYQTLNDFLRSPRNFAPGTKMTFAGIADEQDRANVIAYLRTQSADPVPLPAAGEPVAQAPAPEQAPAAQAPVEPAPVAEVAPAGGGSDIGARLAAATVEAGQTVSRRCGACHSFDEGGPNKIGPPLYGVVGRSAGTMSYNYSAAFEALAAQGVVWTYEELDAYLAGPRDFAPGTKMALALADPADRANLLAYLGTLSADPVPLPAADPAP